MHVLTMKLGIRPQQDPYKQLKACYANVKTPVSKPEAGNQSWEGKSGRPLISTDAREMFQNVVIAIREAHTLTPTSHHVDKGVCLLLKHI